MLKRIQRKMMKSLQIIKKKVQIMMLRKVKRIMKKNPQMKM